MKTLHTHYRRYLELLTERLIRRTLDEASWQARRDERAHKIRIKERIWARQPSALEAQTQPYLARIDAQLDLTEPALQQMKSYRSDDERDEYTRLVDYRGALLDERARVEALLEGARPGAMAA